MLAANSLFVLSLVIALAAFLGAWSAFFRLPLIIAYILAGIIAGPFFFHGQNTDTFNLLRDLGLGFLLFLVGLEIKTDELREYGKQALTTGVIQISATATLAFFLSLLLGFGAVASFFVAAAVTFSSTVIVVKLLSEKRDFDSLYGKITVAILLLQDIVAIFFLIVISGLGSSGFNLVDFLLTVIVGSLLVGLIYLLNQKILPYLFERLARNTELLFLSSLAWMFLVVAIASKLNFSIEIGAFLAGLGLASLKQEHQIAARIRPLRDFFVVIFFIILGSHIVLDFSISILFKALILSAFVLLVKPLIVAFTLGKIGFKRRTGFMSGIALAQISEFSLIIMFLGLKNGQIGGNVVSIVTLAALITIAVSSYLLVFSTKIYRKVEKYLKVFEGEGSSLEQGPEKDLEDHVVLIGSDRLGWEILNQVEKQGKEILVIDFNPTIINALKKKGINYLFGDITDPDIFQKARIGKASLLISTVFDPEDTEELLEDIKLLENKPIVFVTAADRKVAVKFYRLGADYVIVPRILSGHQVAHLLTSQKLSEIKEGELKKEHLEELRETMDKLAL